MGASAELRVAGRSKMLCCCGLKPKLVRCTGHWLNLMLGVLVQVFGRDVVDESLGRECKFDTARVASCMDATNSVRPFRAKGIK